MSIRRAAIVAAIAPVLMAQTSPDPQRPITAEEALAAANRAYGPEPEVQDECAKPSGEEIVVCAQLEEQSQFRVPSTSDGGDNSKLQWEGDPPDVAGPGIFKGPATMSGCIQGLTCPPPPAYIFEITALPEAPEGSDADKIAKGEMKPR